MVRVRIRPAGPAAWYVDVASEPSTETALAIGALQRSLLARAPASVRDVVPGYTNLLVEFRPGASRTRLESWLRAAEAELEGATAAAPARRTVGVRYGEDADVEELERRLGLPWASIAALHAGAVYNVAFLGFTPGFPYLLGLPRELVTPRRDTPRKRVPAGSVAIAGEQAGIYPSASPGGWWVLGRTDEPLFDTDRWPPTEWSAGDEVRFAAEPAERSGAGPGASRGAHGAEPARAPLGDPAAEPAFEVVEAWPASATVQADARWRVGHYGMAQGGALDPLALELANGAAGNAAASPALEVLALPLVLRSLRTLDAALAGGGHRARLDGRSLGVPSSFRWPRGAVLELLPGSRARGFATYLALSCGVAAHLYAGSASTDLRAGAGGSRRPLQEGDVVGVGPGSDRRLVRPDRPLLSARYPQRIALHVHPGPQHDPGTFARLTAASFRVASQDRTGVRLEGPAVTPPAADVRSEGSPWGAVQLPASGQPIILLADRGRTGGYAKPAVVDVRDLWRLAQAPTGTEVWLIPAGGDA